MKECETKIQTALIRAAAISEGVRFLRIDLCGLARAAEVSPTIAARFVRGHRVGPRSVARLEAALMATRTT